MTRRVSGWRCTSRIRAVALPPSAKSSSMSVVSLWALFATGATALAERGDDAGESVLIFGTVKDDGKLILGAELAAGAFARPLSLREFEFYSLML